MWRSLVEEFLLFILPFGCFAIWLAMRRHNPLKPESWHGAKLWLSIVGMVLIIVSLVYAGINAGRHSGAFEPSHLENGVLVPGRFNDGR